MSDFALSQNNNVFNLKILIATGGVENTLLVDLLNSKLGNNAEDHGLQKDR